jgi:DNA-binding NarL/FixJ family response regulator
VSVEVLVVDDDAMVRAGLRLVLSGDAQIQVVAEAANGAEAVAQARRLRPDVILLDLQMPVLDGIAATRALRQAGVDSAVLVLTTFSADDYVLDALQAGANGYLLKDVDPVELARAVHLAAAGESVFSATVTEQLVRRASPRSDSRSDDAQRRLRTLTEREVTVARAVAAGLSNAAIGEQLFMSEATVKTHVSRILTKFRAVNRVQIAIVVFEADS